MSTQKSAPVHQLSGRPMQMGLLLKLPYMALERHLDRGLRDAGYEELRPAHYTVFQVIRPEGSRLTDLAERAGMTKQSMGYLVDYLEQHGYLERIPDPADQRASIIRITAKAKRMDEVVERTLEALHDQWAQEMGPAKFDQLRKRLGELVLTVQRTDTATPAPPRPHRRRTAAARK